MQREKICKLVFSNAIPRHILQINIPLTICREILPLHILNLYPHVSNKVQVNF